METFKFISDIVSLVANSLTSATALIALYVYLTKRREFSAAFNLLLNWSFQTTLSDLRGKLDILNEYNASEPEDLPEIVNILHEIAGQIRGNSRLSSAAPNLATRIESLARSKKLSEPQKRAMVAELREALRNIQVNSMQNISGANNE